MIAALLVSGAVGGLLSGFFGVGGGIVMVPLLMIWAGMNERRAAATSLVAIVPTAIAGSITFGVAGQVDLTTAVLIGAGAIAGAPLGALLLRAVPLLWLRWLFIAGLLAAALRLILFEIERGGQVELSFGVGVALVALGLIMGVASGLFGIGGGVIAVPVLIAVFGAGDLVAKGTSLAAMIPTAIAGTIPNLRAGLVDLRQGVIVGVAAVVFSQLGVVLAFIVPPAISGPLFGVFLILVVTQLVVRAIRLGTREQ